ncbi:hypothetical protein Z959_07920 [Clostridium novyi B str. ATCC 27606]|uniref:Uncharacterized protein n=1 Tax=Clostridium novyi B str. ATCC 27606 TaxID=1443123 RepID=A0AA40IUR2_CLONO|nr:hypothetical protein [Clostridium novyi]KEI16995.1 hypothetical protein Z959_07920 [Clostridium novyi B str. ATCC 27606]
MNNKTYLDLIEYTIFNTYPDYYVSQLLEMLEKENLIITKKRMLKKKDINEESKQILNVSAIKKPKDKLKYFIRNNIKFDLCKFIEEYEFIKGYRHSVILKFNSIDYNIINILKQKNDIIMYQKDEEKYDFISSVFCKPTCKEENNKIFLKFSRIQQGFISENDKVEIKYPVLVIIDLTNNLVEIRFDQIRSVFQNSNKLFYNSIVNGVIGWIEGLIKLKLQKVELKPKVKKIIEQYNNTEDAEVIPIRRDVFLKDGSKVVLDIDANKEFIVPIIGDLKFIINNNQEEKEKAPNIISQIEKLISKVEEGDVPKVSLFWKDKDIILGIAHDYKEKGYSLLHYYGEIKSSEKMDYVREYLIKC